MWTKEVVRNPETYQSGTERGVGSFHKQKVKVVVTYQHLFVLKLDIKSFP